MGTTKVPRWVGACLLAAILPVLVACGGAGSTSTPDGSSSTPEGSTGAGSSSPAAAATGPGNAAAGPDLGDPCTLLTRSELSTVFADGVPEPEGTSYGAGFAECVWEDTAERLVRLSVVPPENLKADYIDQLTIRDGVVGLGEGSVTFPGIVGIGTAKRGGITAAFAMADSGVLLAVKTGDGTDETADLIHVTLLGQRLLSRAR